ncbi:uncharacterized protein LOC134716811 [Mytilus trossulus]|uniref:uncharacterized protein LOC134716811 n=1 Tax=Mytilus trossulus TaxID=6551 RepID=UPI0030072410
MSNDDSKELSKVVSKALCIDGMNGISEKLTRLSKSSTQVIEFINKHKIDTIYGGSQAEGTETKESDFDQMTVVPDITVCMSKENAALVHGHVFELNANVSQPGYCRLKVNHLGNEECDFLQACQGSIQNLLEEQNDGIFLSSDKFVKFFVNLPKRLGFCVPPNVRHGPCTMCEVHSSLGRYIGKLKEEKDHAYSLQCEEWPHEAKEWFRRKRLHDWPKTEIIDTIKMQSCHAVPVGDRISSNFSREWRISFLLQERELVWSFNDTQLHCYILMKKILKKYIEPTISDELSSYQLKTNLFWLLEEQGTSIWQQENLLQCMTICFERLLGCIENEALEHYFHRKRNLFANKLKNEKDKIFALDKIREIMNNIETSVLECLHDIKDLAETWETSGKDTTVFLQQCKLLPRLNELYFAVEEMYQDIHSHVFEFNICLSSFQYDEKEIAGLIVKDFFTLDDKLSFQGITSEEKMFIPAWYFYSIRVGMLYYRYVKSPINYDRYRECIDDSFFTVEAAIHSIGRGCPIDHMSGMLYIASVHLNEGRVAIANKMVLEILKVDNVLMYVGRCSEKRCIQLTIEGIPEQRQNLKKHMKKEMPHTFDVVFSPNDIHCVPTPVGYECYVTQLNRDKKYKDSILFHPCVYAQFLLCFGYYKIGKRKELENALDQLHSTIESIKGGYQRYRALNLLGNCYYLNGKYQQAFSCFQESISLADNRVQNAATYHICIMLMHILDIFEQISREIKLY